MEPFKNRWIIVALLVVVALGMLYFLNMIVGSAIEEIETGANDAVVTLVDIPRYEVQDGYGFVIFSVFLDERIHQIRVPVDHVAVQARSDEGHYTSLSGTYVRRLRTVEWRDATVYVLEYDKYTWDRWLERNNFKVAHRINPPGVCGFDFCK